MNIPTEKPWSNTHRSGAQSNWCYRCKYCSVVSLSKSAAILHAATVHGVRPVKP